MQVLSVAVYNHYKRIYHESSQKRLVHHLILMHFVSVCFFVISRIRKEIVSYDADTFWEARSAGETDSTAVKPADDDMVELEKSNILLMGPTGSGNILTPICKINTQA